MFTKNKRNYRTFLFSAVIVTLSLLVIALAWPVSDEEPAGEGGKNSSLASGAEKAEGQTKTGAEDEPDSQQAADMDEEAGKTDSEEDDMNSQDQSYYLVKRAGEQIAVFFCDTEGNTVQLENTEILYEMLGPEDQKLFEEGIRVKTQEELSVLLQDFES